MRTLISGLIGGVLGAVFCVVALRAFNLSGAMPNFPAYGGEHDFSLRTAWFVLAVIPGFLFAGAWVGVLLARQRRAGLYALAGALAGTVAYMAGLLLLTNTIEALPSQSANVGAIIAELVWVGLVILGVQIGAMMSKRQ
jgi:hypothetical protein